MFWFGSSDLVVALMVDCD